MRILIITLVILLSRSLAAETLTIVSDHWFPMNGDPQSQAPGYMIELAEAVFRPHNIDINYKILPWERSVKQTRNGNYNCVIGAYKSDAPDFIFPKNHWGYDAPKFFVKAKDSWEFDGSLASMKARKIGLIQGYTYYDEFDRYAKNSTGTHIQYAKGGSALETNIKKIMAGRIDTLVDSSSVIHAKLKQLNLSGALKDSGNIIKPVKMYMACSPNMASSQRYIDIIDKETKRLTQNGQLQKILKRYGLSSWNVE